MANNSGLYFKPNEIQNNQTTSSNFDDSHIICGQIQTEPTWLSTDIHVKGNLILDPAFPLPTPVIDQIVSSDSSSSVMCQNGSLVQVQGVLDMQTNSIQNLQDPILVQDAVTLNYVQNNCLPLTANINQLNTQTADYDANGFKLTNLAVGTNPSDAVVLSQLGGGAFTNIQFGSINMALFHTSRSTPIPVTGVSGIIISATKINYGTPSLSTTIQGNLVTANYPAFSNIPRIQCQMQNTGYTSLNNTYDLNVTTCDIVTVGLSQCVLYIYQKSAANAFSVSNNMTIHLTFFVQ